MTVSLRLPAFYSDCFELPLPDGHRFPMAKYRLLRERVQRHADEQIGRASCRERV